MNNKFKKENSGSYMITDRKTLPPPVTVKPRTTLVPSGKIIGSKKPIISIPPSPRAVMPPVVEEKPMKTATPEAEKLKKKLGHERDPEENTTGISYAAFIAGIDDAKKIENIKDPSTGKAVMAFILQTEYGDYVLSRKPLRELRDLHARFLDLDCDTNRKMRVPIHEIKDKKAYFYFEKIEKKLELDIDVDYSEVGFELSKNLLRYTDLPEIERIINNMERKRNTLVNTEIENIEVVEDPLFDLYYLAVKTEFGEEYWIFIKEDKPTKMEFGVPEMSGMVEVETPERVYGVVSFFNKEPIDTNRISEMPEN